MRQHRSMTKPSIAWAAVATVGLLAGCGQGGSPPAEETGSGTQAVVTDAPATDDVVAATWALGVQTLRSGEGANVVVSPSSLVTALAMLAEGAVGDESAPFDVALGASGQHRTDAVNALLTALARYDGDPAVVQDDELPTTPMLHTAQRVVVDDDAEPAQQFLDRLQQGYGAGVLTTDLGSDTGTEALSAWVKENTGGLVEKSAIVPDPLTTAVLQDALVLAAAWQQQFDPDDTHDADFSVPGQATVRVPTMQAELSVPTVKADGWQAVRLPYTDDLSADLLLPLGCDCPPDAVCDCPSYPEVDDPALIDPQTLAGLSAALDDAQADRVKVAVPTLDLATTTDLMKLLDQLGIGADHPLTGVRADGEPVYVSQAVQQTVLEVAEDGTRAAAVTEIAVGVKAAPERDQIEEIRFDRPFLLVVRDGSTGWPVLLASVTDPR